MNRLYQQINQTIEDYLITNKGHLDPEVETDVEIAHNYTNMWAREEAETEWCLECAKRLDQKLYQHIATASRYGIGFTAYETFTQIILRLDSIDDSLTYEERCNFGLGPNARRLRKEWRRTLRKAHKFINRSVKHKIAYIKEWSKPRKQYISNGTGEVHNGLWYTLKALVKCPGAIKYGFRRINQ